MVVKQIENVNLSLKDIRQKFRETLVKDELITHGESTDIYWPIKPEDLAVTEAKGFLVTQLTYKEGPHIVVREQRTEVQVLDPDSKDWLIDEVLKVTGDVFAVVEYIETKTNPIIGIV